MARGLGDIIVSSRPYDEYRAMFGLTDGEIATIIKWINAGAPMGAMGSSWIAHASAASRAGDSAAAGPAVTAATALPALAKAGGAR